MPHLSWLPSDSVRKGFSHSTAISPVSSMLGLFVPHKHRFTEETDMDCQATLSISVTQCDPTSATTPLHWPAPATVHVSCPAKQLAPQQRRDLAIQVLAGTETVSELAREHEVSRKFLYQQVHTAEAALGAAFACSSKADDVLFYLPVTKAWLRQLVLALVFICHSSTRGVVELLATSSIFGSPWGPCTTSCTAPLLSPENQPAVRPLQHPHRPPR